MKCALCHRPIPRADIDSGLYVRSSHTGDRYCGPHREAQCLKIYRKRKRTELAPILEKLANV